MTGKNDCVSFDVAQVIIRVDDPIFPHKQLQFKSTKKIYFVAAKVFQHFHVTMKASLGYLMPI